MKPPQVAPHFGVVYLPFGRRWPEVRDAAQRFERLGFDSFWIPDHLIPPPDRARAVLEGWSLLAGLAAATERIQLGTLITPAGLRNPAHLGKVIATVDQISGGRVLPGLGAGWSEAEFAAFGMPFHDRAARMDQLREVAQFLRRFWREPQVTFAGSHVLVRAVVCEPKPVRPPPILIAAAGEKRALRIVAEEADIWNNAAGDHERLDHKLSVLRGHCAAVGRDRSAIRVSQQCLVGIAPDIPALDALVAKARAVAGPDVDVARHPFALTGTPDQIASQIERHIALDCRMFLLDFFGTDPLDSAGLFAREVIPRFSGRPG